MQSEDAAGPTVTEEIVLEKYEGDKAPENLIERVTMRTNAPTKVETWARNEDGIRVYHVKLEPPAIDPTLAVNI